MTNVFLGDRGSAAIALMGAVAFVMVIVAGLGDLAIFTVARSKAQTAADAAALAAASEQVPGIGRDPVGLARRFAAANGARLVSCSCPLGAKETQVTVQVPVKFLLIGAIANGSVGASARAEMNLDSGRGRSAE
ncbi:MAG: Rv3654c family TadE-like protein [Actinomycetota bacterium]